MPTLSRPTFSITARLHPCPDSWPNLTHRVNEFSEEISSDGNRATTTAKVHRNCQVACIIGLDELCRVEEGNFERVDINIWVEEKIVESHNLTLERLAEYNDRFIVSSPLQLGVRNGVLAMWISIYWKPDLIKERGRVTQNFFDIRYLTEYGMALIPLQKSDPVAVLSRRRDEIKSSDRIKKEMKPYQSSSSPLPTRKKATAASSIRNHDHAPAERDTRGPAALPPPPPRMCKNVLDVATTPRANGNEKQAEDNKTAKLKHLVGSLKALNDSIPPSNRSTKKSFLTTLNDNCRHSSTQSRTVKDDGQDQSVPSSEKSDATEEGQIPECPAPPLSRPEESPMSPVMDMSQLIKETTVLKVKRKYEEARAALYAEKRMLYAARRKAMEERLLLEQERMRWERSEQRVSRESSLCRRIS